MSKRVAGGRTALGRTFRRKATQALFLHIQKTAGSSIVNLASEHYGVSMISYGGYVGHKAEEFKSTGFVSGHFGYKFARPLMSDRYSFTFLRDPIDRVLSFYYFCTEAGANEFDIYKLAHELDLEAFLELSLKNNNLRTAVCNNQAWQLAHGYGHGTDRNYFSFTEKEMLDLAIGHLEKFSHVGFTETFEQDRDVILGKLGIPVPDKNLIINKGADRPSIRDLPDSTVELLGKVTRLDQALYEHAWSGRLKY